MLSNKKILITNDDGIIGVGLLALVKEIYKFTKDIMVVVPDKEMSAMSHRLSIRDGLFLNKVEPLYEDVLTYTLSGTPADCVKFSIVKLNYKPDYVLSGMNNGLNLGNDILYSGTVGACFEAALYDIKSLAFSCDRGCEEVSKFIPNILEYIYNDKVLNNKLILNINIPTEIKGFVRTTQGKNPFENTYELREDGAYYLSGYSLWAKTPNKENSDIVAYHNNFVSITPLTINRTDED